MDKYTMCDMCVTKNQMEKMKKALEKGQKVKLNFCNKNLKQGGMKLPLTKAQTAAVENAIKNNKGVVLSFSRLQLKDIEKHGGFLPLLAALPALLGAAGGLAGGIASAVNSSRQTAEQQRHDREMEKIMRGSGIVSNAAEYVPIFGKQLSAALKKIGLGRVGFKIGNGLYLEPYGSGFPPKH